MGVVPSPSKNTLLGDIKNSPSNDVKQSEIPSSKNSPSKTRRHKGLGSGSIQWKIITLHGKDYPQAWYHYEFWKDGDRSLHIRPIFRHHSQTWLWVYS